MGIRVFALTTTALLSANVFVSAAAAQAANTSDNVAANAAKDGDIVVVGVKQSIQKSLDRKRASTATTEVITAEDVTKYPDVNVAESLSRLSGITIDRSGGGEGAKVAINGVDSRLILTTFNGQPIATAEEGANNRDTGRSFNFRTLAPELIGSVEVYKTQQARLDEGGIGGVIAVNSRMPLDLPSGTLSLSANYNINLRNKEKTPRATALYNYVTEDKTFGILGSVSYNKSVLGSGSVNTAYQTACNAYGWGGCNKAETAFAAPASLATVTSGPALTPSMLVPQYISLNQSTEKSERITAYLAVQIKPVDNFEVDMTGVKIWSDFSSYSQTFLTDLSVSTNQSNAYDSSGKPITRLSSVTTQAAGVTGGSGNVAIRQDEYYKRQKINTDVYNFKLRWAPGPLELIGNAGITQATGGVDPEYYLSFYGNTSGSFAMGRDGATLDLAVDPSNPALFKTRTAGQQAGFVKTATSLDRYEYAKLDGKLTLDYGPLTDLLFGGRLQRHISENVANFYNTVFPTTGSMSNFDTYNSDPDLIGGLGIGGDLRSFVGLTQQAVIDFSVANKSPGNASGNYRDAGNQWDVSEDTKALYAQINFHTGKLSGDAGVRYVKTVNEQTYRSTLDYDPWFERQVTLKTDYEDWLPSANLVFDVNDEIKLRASASKVMSRPTFFDISGQIEYSLDRYSTQGQFFGGTGGNPDLKPYRAWNYGASFEWYFAKGSLFNVDLFYKDVQSYIVRKNIFVDVTVPDDALTNYCQASTPATPNTNFCAGKLQRTQPFLIFAPFNGSNAAIKGVSVGLTSNIAYGFGIQANGTFLAQKYGSFTDQYNQTAGKLPLPYLSKWSYTISPYFERGPVQARVSYTWRDKYITQVGSEMTQPQYLDAFGQLDAQASYNVSDRLQVTFSAQNLADPTVRPVSTGNLPLGFSKYGRRLTAGLTYRMF